MSGTCLVAIIVLCGVVTAIEGTQRSKKFFLTLEYFKRFYSPNNRKDVLSQARAIIRDQIKVTKSTKPWSNHFVQGYRTPECPTTPTHYMRGPTTRLKLKDLHMIPIVI